MRIVRSTESGSRDKCLLLRNRFKFRPKRVLELIENRFGTDWGMPQVL
jgi:hypothetical protein